MIVANKEEIVQLFPEIKSFNDSLSAELVEMGRHHLGNEIYANLEEYTTVSANHGYFESHKKYIDIQHVIEGKEYIIVTDVNSLTVKHEYDIEKDIIFYNFQLENKNMRYIIADNSNYIVLFPSDAHMPCISVDNIDKVKKVVNKVPFNV